MELIDAAAGDMSKGKLTSSQKLQRLAAPLEPAQMPRYVRRRELSPGLLRYFPADGWYWTPAGGNVLTWLATSYDEASWQLRRQLDRLDEAA